VDLIAPEEYCRQIEAYLCRKNDGHLIRIVGPSFELVCGWAERGIPIKIAFHGIDECFERYYAKGARRRPVRIDFCEADVLDAFDEWRRAVGVTALPTEVGDEDESRGHRESLPAHLDRVIARLTIVRSGDDRSLDPIIDPIVSELDRARASAKGLRGILRAELLERLADLDAHLMERARVQLAPDALEQLTGAAEAELAPFRGRMPRDAYQQALVACTDRLIRERARLPVLRFE
jgi:hypothetical protein